MPTTSMVIPLALVLLALLLYNLYRKKLSFGGQKSSDYQGTNPDFDIRKYLNGPIQCEGLIFGPDGKMATKFVADMEGSWSNEAGTLSENFRYMDGHIQKRRWLIQMGENGAFTATAPDVIGQASGQQMGSTVRMTYRLRLEKGAGGHVLDVTDWLYLMENGSIMNKSEMRKFGIKVAELVATMRIRDSHLV